jgi:hypothetical protein
MSLPLSEGGSAAVIRKLASELLEKQSGAIALSLERIEVKELPDVYFDLYLNLPDGTKPAPSDPHFVGSLNLFGVGPHGAGHGAAAQPLYVRIAFPQALLKLIADEKLDAGKLEICIIPQTGRMPIAGAVTKPRDRRTPVAIRRIQVLQMR